jgi:hypothetical protein
MLYEIVNQPKKIETALLDRAVSFACDYLELEVDFTLMFESLKNLQCGFCDYDEDEVIVTIAKRLSPTNAIRTLFHELAHVKQYADGRLENGSPQIWMGNPIEDTYENLPWEIEAFEIEENMMSAFKVDIHQKLVYYERTT